jgi:hypothetical protein
MPSMVYLLLHSSSYAMYRSMKSQDIQTGNHDQNHPGKLTTTASAVRSATAEMVMAG